MQKKSEDEHQRNLEEVRRLAQEWAASFERQAEEERKRADDQN
jgi:hypothetical protein